ncbi:MAG: hypothetical protein ACPIOQ_77000, partial [Promethearchaeia archaeon]
DIAHLCQHRGHLCVLTDCPRAHGVPCFKLRGAACVWRLVSQERVALPECLTLEWGGCFVHRATGASSINDEVVFQPWLATDASIKGKGLTYSIGRMQQRMVSPVVAGALR